MNWRVAHSLVRPESPRAPLRAPQQAPTGRQLLLMQPSCLCQAGYHKKSAVAGSSQARVCRASAIAAVRFFRRHGDFYAGSCCSGRPLAPTAFVRVNSSQVLLPFSSSEFSWTRHIRVLYLGSSLQICRFLRMENRRSTFMHLYTKRNTVPGFKKSDYRLYHLPIDWPVLQEEPYLSVCEPSIVQK